MGSNINQIIEKEIKVPELEKTKWGWYQFKNKPTQEELAEYYGEQYFQKGMGNYRIEYTEEELKHKTFISSLWVQKALSLYPDAKSIYDVGCGEGFLTNEFYKRGLNVKSCDFSNAIEKYFPHLSQYNTQGDLYKIIQKDFSNNKYDIILLMAVLEHTIAPIEVLQKIKVGIKNNGLLIINVPNDFSDLQKTLVEKKQMRYGRWLGYPDHLNFFNTVNFPLFMNDMGFEVVSKVAEFPIDIFLLNDILNYDKNPSKGRNAYSIVRDFDLYLSTLDISKVLKLYEDFADLGLGRDITYFCKLKG